MLRRVRRRVKDGEDLEEAMRREVREESGVRVGDVDVLGDFVDEVGEGGAGDLVTVFVTRGGIDLDDIDLQKVPVQHLARELGVTRS